MNIKGTDFHKRLSDARNFGRDEGIKLGREAALKEHRLAATSAILNALTAQANSMQMIAEATARATNKLNDMLLTVNGFSPTR